MVTNPNSPSYMVNPFTMDSIGLLNPDGTTYHLDPNTSSVFYDLDTLRHGITDRNPFGKPQLYKLLREPWTTEFERTWKFFNMYCYCYMSDYTNDSNSVYIVKSPDSNMAYVYKNIENIIRLPYNPCDRDQMILITRDYTKAKDSIIFSMIDSRSRDTIYSGAFPFNGNFENGTLFIGFPDYTDMNATHTVFIDYADKYKYQQAGLKLNVYYTPHSWYLDEREFKKFKNRHFYYKLGHINTCDMKFHRNYLAFLQKDEFKHGKNEYKWRGNKGCERGAMKRYPHAGPM